MTRLIHFSNSLANRWGVRARAVAALVTVLFLSVSSSAAAQNLGPFRQFLAFEGFYTRLQLDAGDGESRLGLDGYGGRLWINLAPFSGPRPNLIDKTALALFWSTTPRRDGVSSRHYGGELDIYPTDIPIGNVIDPFVSLGVGGLRIDNRTTSPGFAGDLQLGSATRLALTPGVGIRVPIPNRLQLRFDARDAIVFGRRSRGSSETRTVNNFEFMAGIGLTF